MMRRIVIMLIALATMASQTAADPPAPTLRNQDLLQRGEHGGTVHEADPFRCELVLRDRSVQLFVYSRDGGLVAVDKARARVSITETKRRRTRHHDLYPAKDKAAGTPCLQAEVDFRSLRDGEATVRVTLHRLTPADRQPIRFSQTFRRSISPDELAIRRQLICPVSGKVLVSERSPVKVVTPAATLFVCCRGCASSVQKSPEKYLKRLAERNPDRTRN